MHGHHLFEYAVVRVFPVLERGEFLNVGVIVFSKRAAFIRACIKLDAGRLSAFTCHADPEQLQQNLAAFQRIAHGDPGAGPIARLEPAERFRWLTAERSTAIQTSRPHTGLSENLEVTTEKLFATLVL